jgi:hypothetical protein
MSRHSNLLYPKRIVSQDTIAARVAALRLLIAEDRTRGALGAHAVTGWIAQLRSESRIPHDSGLWIGQMPKELVTYIGSVRFTEIGSYVVVTPDGCVAELTSARHKRPIVRGLIIIPGQPVWKAEAPALVVETEGSVT